MSNMSHAASVFALVISTAGLPVAGEARQNAHWPEGDAAIVGDWRGESFCVVRESACHDEDSLYHLARLPERPGRFSLKADKIVNGKNMTMGTTECSYDLPKHTLTCELPNSVMRFIIRGDKMEGTMTVADGKLWRRISLQKSGS
jgi:hypothetical protein